MKNHQKLPELFRKIVDDGATEEEVAAFLGKIRDPDASANLNDVMEEHWNHLMAADQLQSSGRMSGRERTQAPARKNNRFLLTSFTAVAALICGLFIAVFFWARQESMPEQGGSTVYVSRTAGSTKTLEILLSDGSKVTLNSGSVLRYPEKFGTGPREVFLEGEAYFDISHDKKKSFLVHTGKLTTSVLGTSFNVMAYKKLSEVAITVLSGKVAVKDSKTDQMVMLRPSQRATMRTNSDNFLCDSVENPTDLIAWRTGGLVFDDAPLDEIALRLSYRFGTDVIIKNPGKRKMKFSGSFSTQDMYEILSAIVDISGAKIELRSGKYFVY